MTADDANSAERPRSAAMRLQKFLAAAGIGSRRHCEEYILAGRVTVDGTVADQLGMSIDPATQIVRMDDEVIRPQPRRYYILNKPPGYLCTNRDPAGRPRAIDLLPDGGARLFTVGRLDENSCGLLLATNDGELAQRLAHPKFQIPRRYVVQVAGKPTPETLAELRKGMYFTEGLFRVTAVKRLKTQGRSTFLEIELKQGQNREIRRLLARAGHKVMSLERVTFGPLKLGNLPPGQYRALRPVELAQLREANGKEGRFRGKPPRKVSSGEAQPNPTARDEAPSPSSPASRKPKTQRSGKAGARGAKRFETKAATGERGSRGKRSGNPKPSSSGARSGRRSSR